MKITSIIVITITIILGLGLIFHQEGQLVSPGFAIWNSKKVESSPSSSPAIKTFKFDSETDLKMELEKVNPAVLDSDFTE